MTVRPELVEGVFMVRQAQGERGKKYTINFGQVLISLVLFESSRCFDFRL